MKKLLLFIAVIFFVVNLTAQSPSRLDSLRTDFENAFKIVSNGLVQYYNNKSPGKLYYEWLTVEINKNYSTGITRLELVASLNNWEPDKVFIRTNIEKIADDYAAKAGWKKEADEPKLSKKEKGWYGSLRNVSYTDNAGMVRLKIYAPEKTDMKVTFVTNELYQTPEDVVLSKPLVGTVIFYEYQSQNDPKEKFSNIRIIEIHTDKDKASVNEAEAINAARNSLPLQAIIGADYTWYSKTRSSELGDTWKKFEKMGIRGLHTLLLY